MLLIPLLMLLLPFGLSVQAGEESDQKCQQQEYLQELPGQQPLHEVRYC